MASTGTPEDHAFAVVRALENGERLPDETARWLHGGFVQIISGDAETLDGALRLRGPGRESLWRLSARERRDAALTRAFALIDGKSRADRIRKLHEAIRAFEFRTWPRVCGEYGPPDRLTPLQRELFAVFECGEYIPRSGRQLERRIYDTNPPGFDVDNPPG